MTFAQAPEPGVHIRTTPSPGQHTSYKLNPAGPIEPHDWGTSSANFVFNFSLERNDHQPFSDLTAGQIEATVCESTNVGSNGQDCDPRHHAIIPISPGDLHSRVSNSPGVVVVIDGSASMHHPFDSPKIDSAKSAISYFFRNLREGDRVGLLTFDERPAPSPLFELNSDRNAASESLSKFQIDPCHTGTDSTSCWTALYASMSHAVAYARATGAQYVVFLTDGEEEAPCPNDSAISCLANELISKSGLSPTQQQYKRNKEAEIIREAGSDIHIYTIGLGDPSSTDIFAGIDLDTLNNISQGTHAGSARKATRNELQGVLSEIDKAIHYDYSLRLTPPATYAEHDGQPRQVNMNFSIHYGNITEVMPAHFTYSWPKGRPVPVVDTVGTGEPVLIRPPVQEIGAVILSKIYASFASVLLFLSLIPLALGFLRSRKQRVTAHKAVLIVKPKSDHVNKTCQTRWRHPPIAVGDPIVECPGCHDVYHLDCWHLNKDRCYRRDCGTEVLIPEKVLASYGQTP